MANLKLCVRGGSTKRETGWLIQFDYDAELVESLKNAIPHIMREWNPDTKTWWVSEKYETALNELFGNWYALAKCQSVMF